MISMGEDYVVSFPFLNDSCSIYKTMPHSDFSYFVYVIDKCINVLIIIVMIADKDIISVFLIILISLILPLQFSLHFLMHVLL